MTRSRMQGDSSAPSPRTSSLTVQLQQAWLLTQLPKVSKPLPLARSFSPNRSPRPTTVPPSSSSSSTITTSIPSRLSRKKPENLSNLSAIRSTTTSLASSNGSGSDEGPGWTPPSTVSLDSSGSAGFSDRSSPGLGGDGGDLWDNMSSSSAAPKEKAESPKKKVARTMTSSSDSSSMYVEWMLRDQSLAKAKCMGQESLAYLVNNDLEDIIGGLGSQAGFQDHEGCTTTAGVSLSLSPVLKAQHSEDVENWIDSLLNAPPLMIQPAELRDESLALSSLTSSPEHLAWVTEDAASCLHSTLERQLSPEQLPDLNELLVQCAESVAVDDVVGANALVGEIRQYSSPYGNGIQRLAHYFTEGLVARLSGSGADLYTALSNRPTAADMVRAYHMFQSKCPYFSLGHMFSNTLLLKVFEGASRVHIVDYGILYGFQWPDFIKSLGSLPGAPPRLRITGIDFPRPGFQPAARLEETGERLAALAKMWGVPFEFQAVASKWENVQPAALGLRHDEVLAVSCLYRLRHLLDESVMPSSPRKVVLNRIRSMNPKVFITAVISASYNVPFFLSRFRESLNHYSYAFDALDSVVSRDCEVRMNVEREILGREILNVVACEGTERVERPETYPSWQRRLKNAGFKILPLAENMIDASLEKMKEHHKDFGIAQDDGWLLLGWKNQIVKGLAAWEAEV